MVGRCKRAGALGAAAFSACVAISGLLIVGLYEPASAQGEPPEHLIGTFEIGAPDGPQSVSEGVPAGEDLGREDGAPLPGLPTEPAAAEMPSQELLFSQAVSQLEQDRRALAQRLFERVIAAGPSSPLASEARRHLAELYQAAVDEPSTPSAPASTWQNPDLAAEARGAADAGRAGPVRATVPQRTARVSDDGVVSVPEAVERRFIVEVGDRVFFSDGSADLGSRARSVLSAQARWLKTHTEFEVRIEGHADDSALRPEQQEELSEARAEAVRQRLIEEGVAAERLGIVPWGREQRIAPCNEALCWTQNRRAVTKLVIPRAAAIRRGSSRNLSGFAPLAAQDRFESVR